MSFLCPLFRLWIRTSSTSQKELFRWESKEMDRSCTSCASSLFLLFSPWVSLPNGCGSAMWRWRSTLSLFFFYFNPLLAYSFPPTNRPTDQLKLHCVKACFLSCFLLYIICSFCVIKKRDKWVLKKEGQMDGEGSGGGDVGLPTTTAVVSDFSKKSEPFSRPVSSCLPAWYWIISHMFDDQPWANSSSSVFLNFHDNEQEEEEEG